MNSSGYIVNVSNITSYVAVNLQEFEVYGFEIAAMTVIGLGPFSDVITNQTFEDGKYTYVHNKYVYKLYCASVLCLLCMFP